MEPDFSYLFHQSSKKHGKGARAIPKDQSLWPEEWKTIEFKTYERLPQVMLEPERKEADFFSLIKKRKSGQFKMNSRPISRSELSLVLEYSCGLIKKGDRSRAQPSGGARYPIEIYPLVLTEGENLPTGLYHYDVANHALRELWRRSFSNDDKNNLFMYSWMENASVAFLMTAVFMRNQVKYGERGYRHILFEAGHIAQNMYLVATALSVPCSALAGTHDEKLEELLDIDGGNESYLYTVALG